VPKYVGRLTSKRCDDDLLARLLPERDRSPGDEAAPAAGRIVTECDMPHTGCSIDSSRRSVRRRRFVVFGDVATDGRSNGDGVVN
jgi:hypothetical protein